MLPLGVTAEPAARESVVDEPIGPLQLEQVYREHFGFAWRSLRHLGVAAADVEDAAQDVFLVVHAKLASFEHRSRIETWIYGICLRVAHARRRRAHVRHEQPTAPDSDSLVERALLEPSAGDASVAVERREAEDMLDRILDAMPIEQRAVFTLFEIEARSCEEIAALCEIPIGTVYSRLRLAREVFRRATTRIEAHDRFHTGASKGGQR
jgi:RNA polymerase sigma-70 factor (ECF subfamily)